MSEPVPTVRLSRLGLVVAGLISAVAFGTARGREVQSSAVDQSLSIYATTLSRLTADCQRDIAEMKVPVDGDTADVLGAAALSMWSYIAAIGALGPPDGLVEPQLREPMSTTHAQRSRRQLGRRASV